jgi:hypothetical protein
MHPQASDNPIVPSAHVDMDDGHMCLELPTSSLNVMAVKVHTVLFHHRNVAVQWWM